MTLALALVLPVIAQAQTNGLYWVCNPGDPTKLCPVNSTYPLPQNLGPVGTAIAGTQTNVTISSATGLTVPAGATTAVIQAQGTNNTSGQCAIWRDDGTNPTGTLGMAIPANQLFYYQANLTAIKFIAATSATCTLSVAYYK